MKRILVIFLIIALPQLVQAQDKNTERELRQLLEDFLEGAGKNDVSMHDRFWAEDLIYTSSSGERFGKRHLMEGVRNTEENSGNSMVWSSEDVLIRVYGDMAVVAFKLVGTPKNKSEKNTYLNSGTFLKRKGEWRAVNWQATRESSE